MGSTVKSRVVCCASKGTLALHKRRCSADGAHSCTFGDCRVEGVLLRHAHRVRGLGLQGGLNSGNDIRTHRRSVWKGLMRALHIQSGVASIMRLQDGCFVAGSGPDRTKCHCRRDTRMASPAWLKLVVLLQGQGIGSDGNQYLRA